MKVLIIEDEIPAAKRLKSQLGEIDDTIEIIDTLDSISQAVKWFSGNPAPDLIFMDIQLSDGLCFEIFAECEVKAPVIFTTAFDDYAIQAFKVNSIDYLMKPIQLSELSRSIEKYNELKEFYSQGTNNVDIVNILNSINSKRQSYRTRFLIKSGNSFVVIDSKDCAYFYVDSRITFLTLYNGKKHVVDYTLEMLEEQLDPARFHRVNRQFIINIDSIINIHSFFSGKLKLNIKPEPPEEVIISRAKVKEVRDWLQY